MVRRAGNGPGKSGKYAGEGAFGQTLGPAPEDTERGALLLARTTRPCWPAMALMPVLGKFNVINLCYNIIVDDQRKMEETQPAPASDKNATETPATDATAARKDRASAAANGALRHAMLPYSLATLMPSDSDFDDASLGLRQLRSGLP